MEPEDEKPKSRKSTKKVQTSKNDPLGNNAKKAKKSAKKKKDEEDNDDASWNSEQEVDAEETTTKVFVDESLGQTEYSFELPVFLQEDNIRDADGHRPNDPEYNPKTLFVPENYYKKCNTMMKQYWDVKRIHFDKLIAINVFDFYWFYYNDAYTTSKLID